MYNNNNEKEKVDVILRSFNEVIELNVEKPHQTRVIIQSGASLYALKRGWRGSLINYIRIKTWFLVWIRYVVVKVKLPKNESKCSILLVY